jgi:uncharacterized protein involved in outer membrane biogenesis
MNTTFAPRAKTRSGVTAIPEQRRATHTPGRRSWIRQAILAAALLVGAAPVALFLYVGRSTPSIEATVSRSLGMEFQVLGGMSLRLLPHPGLSLRDVHLSSGGIEILSAEQLQVSPRWIPLILRRDLSIDRLSLDHPKIRIEPSNRRPVIAAVTASEAGTMSLVSVRHGDVVYVDATSGASAEAGDVNLNLSDISWGQGAARQPLALLNSLSLHGSVHAATLHVGGFKASDVNSRIADEAGLLRLESTDLALFGGNARGSLVLDLRESLPRARLVQTASAIDAAQLFPAQFLFGKAQTSLDVEFTGSDRRAITTSLKGRVAIRSEHMTVKSVDVDGLIADYNRTQNFSLIDLAAVVIAGPFAPLATKGADFTRLTLFGHKGQGESSEIRRVVSDWTMADGIATAQDVAFTTPKNTVAFRGDLDLAHGRYRNFFVATVDQHGCAQVKRQISGSLASPQAQGPVSAGLGPFTTAFRNAKKLFQSQKCDLFYSGSAIH